MKKFKVGEKVMTHRGKGSVIGVHTDDKYTEYEIKFDKAQEGADTLSQIYVDPVLLPGTEVVYYKSRRVIESVLPGGYVLVGDKLSDNCKTSVEPAPPIKKLSRKHYKAVRMVWEGENPSITPDENGNTIVPIEARFSYFWGNSGSWNTPNNALGKEAYERHNIEWID